MKGILYKELRLNMGLLIILGAVQLIAGIYSIVMAALIGKNPSDTDIVNVMLINAVVSFSMFYFWSLISASIFQYDSKHAWQNFAASAPTGASGQVAGKYLLMLFIYLASLAFYVLLYAVISLIIDTELYPLMLAALLAFSVMVILTSLELPFFFAFGGTKGASVKGISICALAFIAAAYLLFGNLSIFSEADPFSVLMAYMAGFVPIVVITMIILLAMPIFCLSMMLSVKLYPIGAANIEE